MQTHKKDLPKNADNQLGQLWARYVPYWPVFLLLTLVGIGGAWVYLQCKLPVYESTASLLIKDEKKGMEDSKVTESMDILSGKKILENEIEVLRSRALLGQVVKELKLYAPVYGKGKWHDQPLYDNSPIGIEAQNEEAITESKQIFFTINRQAQTIGVQGHNYPLNTWTSTPWGTLRFSAKNTAYESKAPLFFNLVDPKRVILSLTRNLTVSSTNKLASIITLALKDEMPRRSEDILNSLMAAYDKASLNDKNSLAENTLSFLDERLKSVSGDLTDIEKKLQQYKSNRGAVDLTSQSKLFLQNVSDNDQKLSEVNMKLSVMNQVEQYIAVNDNRGNLVPSTFGIDDPLLTNLLKKLYDTELDYEKLKQTTGENNPQLMSLRSQIDKMKPSILENVQAQKESLEASKRNLFATNSSYSGILQNLPQQERDIVEISREQNIKSAIYSLLLQKREETALSHSSIVSNSRVIDKAESSLDPVGIGKKLVYGIAVLLALGIGVAFITLSELFSRTVLYRREIEETTSFPVIGEIVYENSNNPIVIEKGKPTFIAEQFRMLRSSLSYLGIGSGSKKILVTSTISGEGKSFVAANLALSLAMAGKKVVLIEFDLSNPSLADKFGMQEERGVSDVLNGEAQLKDVIRKTHENANLSVISAGNLPADPSDLIFGDRPAALMAALEKQFDYVIVDTAPVGLLSDGYVLSKLCDATLYIVRHRNTPRIMLERLGENNRINELKNLGIVFNGVRARGFGRNTYGYGYGYGYIYGRKEDRRINRRTYSKVS